MGVGKRGSGRRWEGGSVRAEMPRRQSCGVKSGLPGVSSGSGRRSPPGVAAARAGGGMPGPGSGGRAAGWGAGTRGAGGSQGGRFSGREAWPGGGGSGGRGRGGRRRVRGGGAGRGGAGHRKRKAAAAATAAAAGGRRRVGAGSGMGRPREGGKSVRPSVGRSVRLPVCGVGCDAGGRRRRCRPLPRPPGAGNPAAALPRGARAGTAGSAVGQPPRLPRLAAGVGSPASAGAGGGLRAWLGYGGAGCGGTPLCPRSRCTPCLGAGSRGWAEGEGGRGRPPGLPPSLPPAGALPGSPGAALARREAAGAGGCRLRCRGRGKPQLPGVKPWGAGEGRRGGPSGRAAVPLPGLAFDGGAALLTRQRG